jgi:hypothetical protein
MREQIESLITQYGLQAQVRITGWISSEQVRAEILAARALVLPSFAEGLPVVIMEAMALRRPVLTTYVAGIPELVRQGENGWLFPAGAVNELATALADCLAQPVEVLQRMGEAAYQECWSDTISIPKRPSWPNYSRRKHDHVSGLAVQCTADTHRPAGVGAVCASAAGLPACAVSFIDTRIAAAGSGAGAGTQ